MKQKQMIDFPKKYKYKLDDVDTAHQLVFERAETLMRVVRCFNETVKQAEWMERHRPNIKKLEMSNGSIRRGDEAESTWEAFKSNDWDTLSGVVMASQELECELEEAGLDYGE